MTKRTMTSKFSKRMKVIFQWKFVEWKFVEKFKVILEILAILTAGLWAYSVFSSTESDLLLPRRSLKAELFWFNKTENECQAEFRVEFQNIGKKNLDIGRVLVRSWFLKDTDSLGQYNNVKLIDPMKIIEGATTSYDLDEDLSGLYKPDEINTKGFLFAVRRYYDSKRVLFKVDLWQKEDVEKNIAESTWSFYTWDIICGE